MDGDDAGGAGEGFPPRFMSAAKFLKKPANSLTARGTLRKHHGSRRGGFMQQSALRSARFNKTATSHNGIFCSQIPDQLNFEDILRQHFEQFGHISELKFFEQNNSVSVIYSTCKEAEEAVVKGKSLDGFSLCIQPYQPSSKLSKTIIIQGSRVVRKDRKSQEKSEICRKFRRRSLNRGETPPSDIANTGGNPFNQQRNKSEERKTTKTTSSSSSSSNLAYRTNKEKQDFLDKIDQLLRVDVVQESDVSKVKSIKGTCPDICPEKERYLRIERNLISIYEMDEGRTPRHDMMIKEYSRSSADRKEDLAHELRPPAVLQATMEYMLRTVLKDIDYDRLADWYDFTWNRTRAIRKDLSIQEANDEVAIGVVEQCARFHICCAHQLCEEEHRTFDPKINNENLEKTMKTLLDMYSDNSVKGNRMKNEGEFKAYHILLNINKSTDVLTELQTMSEEIRTSADISLAISAFCSVHSHNYVRFFKIVQQCNYLQAALLHRYFTQVRMDAIITMKKAYRAEKGLVQISTEEIINILQFNGMEELEHFATYNNIPIENGMVQLHRNSELGNDDGPSMSLLKSHKIEYKMNGRSLADIISNGAIMHAYINQPTFSFDEQDRYIGDYEHLLQSNYQPQTTATEASSTHPTMSGHDDVTSSTQSVAPLSSREMAALLEKRGIPNDVVKFVAKNLINSAIDESLREVCNQTLRETSFQRISILVADRVLEEEMASQIRQIATTTMHEVATHRRQEEERLKRDLELRMRRAAEERKMKEEQMKLEQMREETRKQTEQMMHISINAICDEIQQEVKNEMCREIAQQVHRDASIAVCCAEICHEIVKETNEEESSKICKETYKEIRNQKFAKLTAKLRRSRQLHVFERWRLQLGYLRSRRILNQSFPGAPPISTTLSHQVARLSRCKNKFNRNNDVTSRLTTSSTISLMKRQRIEEEKIQSLAEEKEKMEEISLNEEFNICDILKKNHTQDGGRKLIWKLTIVVYSGDEEFVEWIGRKFGIDDDEMNSTRSCSRHQSNFSYVCNMINGDELTEHSLFATSAIVAINVGKRGGGGGGCYDDNGKNIQEIMANLQENVEEMPPVCIFTKSLSHQDGCYLNSADEDAIKCLIIEDDVIRNHIQMKRDLDWLTCASYKQAVLLTGKTLRSYYEGMLMENCFQPLRACCNTIDTYNLQPIPADDVIESYNYVITTAIDELMTSGCYQQWPSNHIPSLIEYSANGGKRWNDQRSLKEIKVLSKKLLLPKLEEFNENEESLEEFVENYCKPFADFDILFEPQLQQLLVEFNQSYYDDLDFNCQFDHFSSFPWLSLVQLIADSLIKGHLYEERNGGRMVYLQQSYDDQLHLPRHILRHIEYVRGVSVTADPTDTTTQGSSMVKNGSGGHKMELEISNVEHESSCLEDSNNHENTAKMRRGGNDRSMLMTSHIVYRSRREEDLNETMNTSFELSDRIFQERQISNRFEKYLEKLLLDGGGTF